MIAVVFFGFTSLEFNRLVPAAASRSCVLEEKKNIYIRQHACYNSPNIALHMTIPKCITKKTHITYHHSFYSYNSPLKITNVSLRVGFLGYLLTFLGLTSWSFRRDTWDTSSLGNTFRQLTSQDMDLAIIDVDDVDSTHCKHL